MSVSDLFDEASLKLLDLIEGREYELLIWGYLDGAFTGDELLGLAEDVIHESSLLTTPNDLLDRLREKCLLFGFQRGSETFYRSRFAEAVRLFAQLRQIFDKDDWAEAPQLVADYRIGMEPRRYPARNVPIDEVKRRLDTDRQLTSVEHAVIDSILHTDAASFELAGFQVEATAGIRSALKAGRPRGVIVCAGTGTGKTLGFYLPCLMDVVEHMERDRYWTKVVAIYPRTELLRDQLCEVLIQARQLDEVAQQHPGRKIRIGAFYGAAPNTGSRSDVEKKGWARSSEGLVCPYLPCPECGGELAWTWPDLKAGRERLTCAASSCRRTIGTDEIALTRRAMRKNPPDILFTTTEMLNRSMSDCDNRQIFGLGQTRSKSPRMILLDEAHSYGGPHGAHVAILLRRWQALVARPVTFVGLSATLTDAHSFFSELTGLAARDVTVVDEGQDLEETGHEYHLVLRGDPVSRTSLLSTSIQTAMLLARILDPPGEPSPSDGVFGSRVFVFTDDLDVTNRLYHYLQDAEALSSSGRPLMRKEPLASHRSSSHSPAVARFEAGQGWRLCEAIGHHLDPPNHRLTISRTSSQDAGVDDDSQVVIATASLELGYDDPNVGAILQHKSPRDPASFVQRRGRAGRRRITRPWTVVVLSDYGRDRTTYQFYESLFSPDIPRPPLPVRNRYVLRIQMVYALMDWLASRSASGGHMNVWNDFSAPAQRSDQRRRHEAAASEIRRLLEDADYLAGLCHHLTTALGITEDELQALLWEPPRALCTAVLPTLLRRLETQWARPCRTPEEPEFDYHTWGHPLPDFVPQSLFSDLKVPDVEIIIPGVRDTVGQGNYISIAQALRIIAPGRVTHRFGVSHISQTHWVQPRSLEDPVQSLDIASFCREYEGIGHVQFIDEGGKSAIAECVRPWSVDMSDVPPGVVPTSNAFLDWRSQVFVTEPSEAVHVPHTIGLDDLITDVHFFTHNRQNPMSVRRFAIGSKASIRLEGQPHRALYIGFTQNEDANRAAIGFEQEVDGMRVGYRLPDWLLNQALKGGNLRSCRVPYFLECVQNDATLVAEQHPLTIEWLSQVFLALLIGRALSEGQDLRDAVRDVVADFDVSWLQPILQHVFQTMETLRSAPTDGEASTSEERDDIHNDIRRLMSQHDVRQRLAHHAGALYAEPDADFRLWVQRRVACTLGSALVEAARKMTPEHTAEDLLLDLDSGPDPTCIDIQHFDGSAIWISETTVGGTGLIEELRSRYLEDPRRFYLLVESSLGRTTQEKVDEALRRVLSISKDSTVSQLLQAVRDARDNQEARVAAEELRSGMAQAGVIVTRDVSKALNARILRPGSSAQSDDLLRHLLKIWDEQEERLGIEIDVRLFCYAIAQSGDVEERVAALARDVVGTDVGARLTSQSILYSMLWPRGGAAREHALATYNPFVALPSTDPKTIRDSLLERQETIALDTPGLEEGVRQSLADSGTARIRAERHMAYELKSSLLRLIAQPVYVEFLQLYPTIAQIDFSDDALVATLHVREVI